MRSWFVLRARTVGLFAIGLVLAGLVPVLSFIGHSLLPGAKVLDFFPQFPTAWLMNAEAWLPAYKVPWFLADLLPGLAFALLGLGAMALGALIAKRQAAALDAERRRVEDGLRRVHQYRDGSRLEPFIGPGEGDTQSVGSAGHQGHDTARRRVA